MNVIHLVHGTNRVARFEVATAANTYPENFPCFIFHGHKPRVVENVAILVTAHIDMNVGNNGDPNSLRQCVESPIWKWRAHSFPASHAHCLTISTGNIQPTVQMIASVSRVKAAAYFTHRCRNFMRAILWVEWPQQLLNAQRVFCQPRERLVRGVQRRQTVRMINSSQ